MPPKDRSRVTLGLIVPDPPQPERADAARNREALLAAAHRVLAADGLDAVTMDRVAAEAGVGIGTVYRRFGDRSGLAFALLDERERQFQEAFLTGPPPLGPGAPARERIEAFLDALLTRLETDADLDAVAVQRNPTARYGAGAYRAARLHLVVLLREAGVDDAAETLADLLLATSEPRLFLHLRRERGLSLEEIATGQRTLVTALLFREGEERARPAKMEG